MATLSPQLFFYGLEGPDDSLGRTGAFYRNIETNEVWGPKTKLGWPQESLGVHPLRGATLDLKSLEADDD